MAMGVILTLLTLYIIGIASEVTKSKKEMMVHEPKIKPLGDLDEFNIYDEEEVKPKPKKEINIYDTKTVYDDLEMETFRMRQQVRGNKAIYNVRQRYEQSGIDLPLELYAQCNQFTTEKEMFNYLETMRKNMAKNLNMKLFKDVKSARESKK